MARFSYRQLASIAARMAAFVAGYMALDRISFFHAYAALNITPWNPPPGLALWLLLVFGRRHCVTLFVAAVVSEAVLRPGHFGHALGTGLVVAAGYTVAAHVLTRRLRVDLALSRVRDVSLLVGVAMVTALVVAGGYVGISVLGGLLEPSDMAAAVGRYWVGDVIGVAVVTPLLLVGGTRPWPRGTTVEGVLQFLAIVVTLALVFGLDLEDEFRNGTFYYLFLPLIWIAVRHGLRGATFGVVATQLGLIAAIAATGEEATTVTGFQLLMLTMTITSLVLGAAVSERRRAEQRLRQHRDALAHVSRLAVSGEMASALAHELNQPLAAAITYMRAAQRLSGSAAQVAVDKAVAQAERAAETIRRLKAFLRRGETNAVPFALHGVVVEAVALIGTDGDAAAATWQVDVPAELPLVVADVIQVEQVFINLLRNALDSLHKGASGVVSVAARRDGRFVEVAVADSGAGIAPDIAERLFMPFVTTKPAGMGLGLSLSRSLIEAQGGRLWLAEGAPGRTCFRFTLPVTQVFDDR